MKFDNNVLYTAILLVIIAVLAYSFTVVVPFLHAFSFLSAVVLPTAFFFKHKNENKSVSLTEYLEEIDTLQKMLSEQHDEALKLKEILNEYEGIFDQQMMEIDCLCGENTFHGLFSPNSENICECEKCKNRFRITINYDSILITDPLTNEEIFDQISKKSKEAEQLID